MSVAKNGQDMITHVIRTELINKMMDYFNKMDVVVV